MAVHVLKDAYLKVNDVDLSAYIRSMTFPLETETVENTAMGASDKTHLPSLNGQAFTARFNQDFAAAKVDASLWAIRAGKAAVAFIHKPCGATTAVTNPKYTGYCILTSYQSVDGGAGDNAEITANFLITGVVDRATAD